MPFSPRGRPPVELIGLGDGDPPPPTPLPPLAEIRTVSRTSTHETVSYVGTLGANGVGPISMRRRIDLPGAEGSYGAPSAQLSNEAIPRDSRRPKTVVLEVTDTGTGLVSRAMWIVDPIITGVDEGTGKLRRKVPMVLDDGTDDGFAVHGAVSDNTGRTIGSGVKDVLARILTGFHDNASDDAADIVQLTTHKFVDGGSLDGSRRVDLAQAGVQGRSLANIGDDAGTDRRAATQNQKTGGDRGFGGFANTTGGLVSGAKDGNARILTGFHDNASDDAADIVELASHKFISGESIDGLRRVDLSLAGVRNKLATNIAREGAGSITDAFTGDGALDAAWTNTGPGTWSRVAGRARCTGATSDTVAHRDLGTSNGAISLRYINAPANGRDFLVFRYSDINNFWIVYQSTGPFTVLLQKKVGGSYITAASGSHPGTPASGDVYEVVLSGSSITVKVNGTTIINGHSDSFNAGATRAGFGSHLDNGTVDDFSFPSTSGATVQAIITNLGDAGHMNSPMRDGSSRIVTGFHDHASDDTDDLGQGVTRRLVTGVDGNHRATAASLQVQVGGGNLVRNGNFTALNPDSSPVHWGAPNGGTLTTDPGQHGARIGKYVLPTSGDGYVETSPQIELPANAGGRPIIMSFDFSASASGGRIFNSVNGVPASCFIQEFGGAFRALTTEFGFTTDITTAWMPVVLKGVLPADVASHVRAVWRGVKRISDGAALTAFIRNVKVEFGDVPTAFEVRGSDQIHASRLGYGTDTRIGQAIRQTVGPLHLLINKGLGTGSVVDGQVVTFSPAFDSTPVVSFGPGGITFSNTLSGKQRQKIQAIGLSASGFTAVCKIEELQGALTLRSQAASDVGGTPRYQVNKNFTPQAYDDTYKYKWRVDLNANSSAFVDLYINNGSGWVLWTGWGYQSGDFPESWNGQEDSVVYDGMDLNDDFGFHLDLLQGSGSLLTMSVEWYEGSAPASQAATADGVAIPFLVQAGNQ